MNISSASCGVSGLSKRHQRVKAEACDEDGTQHHRANTSATLGSVRSAMTSIHGWLAAAGPMNSTGAVFARRWVRDDAIGPNATIYPPHPGNQTGNAGDGRVSAARTRVHANHCGPPGRRPLLKRTPPQRRSWCFTLRPKGFSPDDFEARFSGGWDTYQPIGWLLYGNSQQM